MNAVPAMLSFNFEGTELRGFEHEGEPWFLAQDACALLGYSNTSKALVKLDEDEKGITIRDTLGGRQQMLTVSESGLWCLIIRSRRPEARRIRRWITQEVLPAIRKTGRYELAGAQPAEPQAEGVSELERLRLHLATINTAHRIYGAAAARKVWEVLGFPKVEPDARVLFHEVPDPDFNRFRAWLEEATARDRQASESLDALWASFSAWLRRRGAYQPSPRLFAAWLERIEPDAITLTRDGSVIGLRLKN
jgi:prophage antirepressor-like protein